MLDKENMKYYVGQLEGLSSNSYHDLQIKVYNDGQSDLKNTNFLRLNNESFNAFIGYAYSQGLKIDTHLLATIVKARLDDLDGIDVIDKDNNYVYIKDN